ncbi:MAG: response regulator [Polyangiaceae bacterium]|nr:response regulator [Polyangiaceae bacterium]
MDSRQDLLPLFLSEVGAALASMDEALDALRARPSDAAAVDRLFRGAHTVGGLGAIAGRPAIAELARLMEGAIKGIGEPPRADGLEIMGLLDSSMQALRQLVALAAQRRSEVPPDVPGLVERLGRACAAGEEEGRIILVVDDSRTALRFAERALSQAGFQVETANNERGAAAFLSRVRPAMILVDLSLAPGDEGDLLARLGGGAPVPVVLFSNRPEEELEEIRRRAGAAGFIRKTGDTAAFVAAVREWLDGRRRAPEER